MKQKVKQYFIYIIPLYRREKAMEILRIMPVKILQILCSRNFLVRVIFFYA
jgi:hypothetical protein